MAGFIKNKTDRMLEKFNEAVEVNENNDKVETLKMMDRVMRKANDEDIFYSWIAYGVVDEATEEDYKTIAQEDYEDVERVFKKLIKSAVEGGLYQATDEEFEFAKRYEPSIENLTGDKPLKEAHTAREFLDASLERMRNNGKDTDAIKVLVETDGYILTGYRDPEKEGRIYLDITTGSSEHRLPDVYIDQDYKGKVESAKVNWGAWGSQPAEVAESFIADLQKAIEFVKAIDGKDFSSEV